MTLEDGYNLIFLINKNSFQNFKKEIKEKNEVSLLS